MWSAAVVLLVANVVYATAAVVSRIALDGVPPALLGFARLGIAAVVLAPLELDDVFSDLVRDARGAATMTLPESPDPPATLIAHRDAVWSELGQEARARYEAFTAATQRFAIGARHHHLNMIGVCRSRQGEGLARALLAAVHALTDSDPASTGTSLSTEHPPNIPLYQHFGYRVVGHAEVDRDLETWVLFRERSPG